MVEDEVGEDEKKISSSSSGSWKLLSSFHRDLMAGGVMGGMVHTIVAPIERVELLLQTQESNVAIILALSLWRGNGSNVVRCYPSVALNFSLKDSGEFRLEVEDPVRDVPWCSVNPYPSAEEKEKEMARFPLYFNGPKPFEVIVKAGEMLYLNILRGNSKEGDFLSGPSTNFIAGSAAGCTTVIIIYPLDIAHTCLAADLGRTESRQFRGIPHFLCTIHEKDGIRGIYPGIPASLQGMIVHRGLYFGGFDTIKEMMSEESKTDVALWKRWVVAKAVTTSAGWLSYPLDTVRRRMMMQSGLEQPIYSDTLDCWRKIYRTEGLASFYCGALSYIFRSTSAAAVLVCMMMSKSL